jgi:hypothetical protein
MAEHEREYHPQEVQFDDPAHDCNLGTSHSINKLVDVNSGSDRKLGISHWQAPLQMRTAAWLSRQACVSHQPPCHPIKEGRYQNNHHLFHTLGLKLRSTTPNKAMVKTVFLISEHSAWGYTPTCSRFSRCCSRVSLCSIGVSPNYGNC